MTTLNTEKKIPARVFFAMCAILGIAGGCKEVGLKDGDVGTIIGDTTCWRYPGGEHASKLEAPLGQEDHGLIREGAKATVTADEETGIFGATSGFGSWVRVVINSQDITPSKGVIGQLAEEQHIAINPPPEPDKTQVCIIDTRRLAPTK